ncbi:hypothetical protein KCP75_18090 [Salmonella enterica subsp. enterica]|nr:hypothetical protein KCP75_18090 [Salmonella enterica subsp. enterica]
MNTGWPSIFSQLIGIAQIKGANATLQRLCCREENQSIRAVLLLLGFFHALGDQRFISALQAWRCRPPVVLVW